MTSSNLKTELSSPRYIPVLLIYTDKLTSDQLEPLTQTNSTGGSKLFQMTPKALAHANLSKEVKWETTNKISVFYKNGYLIWFPSTV